MARSGRVGMYTGVWLQTLLERDSFEDLGVNSMIILTFWRRTFFQILAHSVFKM